MDAVPGQRTLDLAAVAKINGDLWSRTHGTPMKDVIFTKIPRNVGVRIKSRPEETTVCAAEFLVQIAEQPKRKYRFVLFFRDPLCLVQVCVPIEMRGISI